jgi:hypothetical protein
VKPHNIIHVVYRNRFFYWLRFLFPRSMLLQITVNGSRRYIRARVGDVLKVPGYRHIRPINLIETIVFSVVTGRKK